MNLDALSTKASPLVVSVSALLGEAVTASHKDVYATCHALRASPLHYLARPKGKVSPALKKRLGACSRTYRWITSSDFMRGRTHWPVPVARAFAYNVVPSPVEYARVRSRGALYSGLAPLERDAVRLAVAYGSGVPVSASADALGLSRDAWVQRLEVAAARLTEDPRALLWALSPDWSRVVLPASVWAPWRNRWKDLYSPFHLSRSEAAPLATPTVIGLLLGQPRTTRLRAPAWRLPHG